jgi:electron transfer flavoprotein alpha subunit
VVVVRDGVLPLGADETVAEAGGTALLVGADPGTAVAELTGARTVWCAENGAFTPARWASQLAPVLAASGPILLPASPDGRDLAPRLAAAMDRPLLAGAVRVMESGAEVVRWGGRVAVELTCEGPFVATFQPGVRGVESSSRTPRIVELFLPDTGPVLDATTIAITGPDPAPASAGGNCPAQTRWRCCARWPGTWVPRWARPGWSLMPGGPRTSVRSARPESW